ncbi:MAG: hypothetical protein ACFE85_10475 [Candidatus Hodarchaeota archaeon]
MEITKSEDCLIFFGFDPKIKKRKVIYKGLLEFMESKQLNDPSDRFNLIMFQKDGPYYLDHFTFDPNLVLKTLKSLERSYVKANLAGGIFVAITFIIDVFKRIAEKVFRLLILVDKDTNDIPPQFIPVLDNLIEKVKDLPFFIDVICIDDQKQADLKVNLTKLVEKFDGKIYHINTTQFSNILTQISNKRYIKIDYYGQKQSIIRNENTPFFINLADDPITIDEVSTCSICFQRDNQGLVKCPECYTITHKVCWSYWAKTSNIGINHVFRCHNCFNILKLDQNFVVEVQEGRIPMISEIKEVKRKNIIEYLREIEAKTQPQIIHTIDPFETEIELYPDSKEKKEKKRAQIKICPNCSQIIKKERKNCPFCGFSLY